MSIEKNKKGKRVSVKNLTDWSKLVLERDKYICQICGQRATISDHIEARRMSPGLIYSTQNGRALCRKCHSKYGSKTPAKNSKSSIIRIGGSKALIIPPDLSTEAFATVVDIGPLIIVDLKGKLEKAELEDFGWKIAPLFWKWYEEKVDN